MTMMVLKGVIMTMMTMSKRLVDGRQGTKSGKPRSREDFKDPDWCQVGIAIKTIMMLGPRFYFRDDNDDHIDDDDDGWR